MKVLLVASPGLDHAWLMERAMALAGYEATEVICGRALGFADSGRNWALAHNIPIHPDLDYAPKGLRRKLALGIAEAVVAVWDGSDKEIPEMVVLAKNYGCTAFLYYGGVDEFVGKEN